jgi:Ca-activated chloride channel family protein
MKARQHYKNTGKTNLEAVYTFPLPWGATLLGLNAEIDGHRLQGTVMEKKEATQRYEKAIDEGDTPIMVERSARGLYSANLGNIKPGESAVIEIEYSQLLRFEQGQIRITIPTTVAPRYGDEHRIGGLAVHQSVEADMLVQYPLNMKITLTGEIGLAAAQSPSHPVAMARQGESLVVSLAQGGFLDRDFVLLLQGLQGKSFASMAPDGEGFAVLASFCPTMPEQIKEPLLLKVLVDCSGSMEGDSISAARKALHEVLKELDEHDRISFSRFGSTVEHDLPGLVPCKAGNIKKVAKLIAKTEADLGGTEMHEALLSTFRQSTGADWKQLLGVKTTLARHQNVLLITDGNIWDVENVIQIAKASGHRVFAIGVGSAPGESLLREVAEKTGGACELVSPNQNVADVIVSMFRRLRSPRCAEVNVDWGQPVLWQEALPYALYGGDTLHLCARLATMPVSAPRLSWVTHDEAMQTSANTIQTQTSGLLPRITADQQITELTQQSGKLQRVKSFVEPAVLESHRQQTLDLALNYQLVTDRTNLILVHVRAEDQKAEGLPQLEKVAHMQTAGWGGAGSVTAESNSIAFSRRMDSNTVMYSAKQSGPAYGSLGAPSVWRNRTSAAAKVDTLSSGGMDDFEIPAFLRRQAEDTALIPMLGTISGLLGTITAKSSPPLTLLELLQAFDAASQKTFATSRFVRSMMDMTVTAAITKTIDEFTVVLGSGAKAWAVLLHWLAQELKGEFTLSRQGERLLRHFLKDEDGVILEALNQKLQASTKIKADLWTNQHARTSTTL